MRTLLLRKTLVAAALLIAASAASASSANFVISAKGIDLGKAQEVVENEKPQPPRYHVKIEQGKSFTLTATGMAYGRGDLKGSPTAPDSGGWTFDDKAFKKAEADKEVDKTQIVVTLTPTAVGKSRVRFSGKVLGYERTFDVVVEVVAAKKK